MFDMLGWLDTVRVGGWKKEILSADNINFNNSYSFLDCTYI